MTQIHEHRFRVKKGIHNKLQDTCENSIHHIDIYCANCKQLLIKRENIIQIYKQAIHTNNVEESALKLVENRHDKRQYHVFCGNDECASFERIGIFSKDGFRDMKTVYHYKIFIRNLKHYHNKKSREINIFWKGDASLHELTSRANTNFFKRKFFNDTLDLKLSNSILENEDAFRQFLLDANLNKKWNEYIKLLKQEFDEDTKRMHRESMRVIKEVQLAISKK